MKINVSLTKEQARAVLGAELSVGHGIRRSQALTEAERRIKDAIRAEIDDPFRCICDPDVLFEPPDPRPVAVEGCPAHQFRRAAQQFALRLAAETDEPAAGSTEVRQAHTEETPDAR